MPLAVSAFDGSRAGPPQPVATVVIRSPDALARILTRPGELGLSRAYVAGDLDIDGDIYAVLALDLAPSDLHIRPGWPSSSSAKPARRYCGSLTLRLRRPGSAAAGAAGAGVVGPSATTTTCRNDFYELVLGPSMTYSCAVFEERRRPRWNRPRLIKHELVCAKLGL